MNIKLLGIDLAKNDFQLHGVDARGKAVLAKRLKREKLLPFIANLPTCKIAMEACSGANHWSRKFSAMGHDVKMISPQYVKPFVKTNKNDSNDAMAITEAASRPSMHFVAPKSIAQQDIQALHRARERFIANRTGLSNQIRGLLAEYGVIAAKGLSHLRRQLPRILENAENELTNNGRMLFDDLYAELCHLDERIKAYNKALENVFEANPVCQRLADIEGLGVVNTTALVAAIGDPSVFKSGRQMSAWLGLVPKQHSSGGRQRLLGISKRGDSYLRKLLVQGARSVIYHAKNKTDKRSQWINQLIQRCGTNKACVAVANKNVRIVWAMLKHETAYQMAA